MRRYYNLAYVAIYSNNNYVKYHIIPQARMRTWRAITIDQLIKQHNTNNWQERTQLYCTANNNKIIIIYLQTLSLE